MATKKKTPAAKTPAAKKATPKKSAPQKVVPKKAVVKKATAKKAVAKKTAPQKTTPKKAVLKKNVSKTAVLSNKSPQKPASGKTVVKKAPAKKAPLAQKSVKKLATPALVKKAIKKVGSTHVVSKSTPLPSIQKTGPQIVKKSAPNVSTAVVSPTKSIKKGPMKNTAASHINSNANSNVNSNAKSVTTPPSQTPHMTRVLHAVASKSDPKITVMPIVDEKKSASEALKMVIDTSESIQPQEVVDPGFLANDDVFDETDHAQWQQLREQAAIQKMAMNLNRPEIHPDFNGEECVECGEKIPPARLQLKKVRCVDCQNDLEEQSKRENRYQPSQRGQDSGWGES